MELRKKKEKRISKGKGKEKLILENVYCQKKVDTIEDHHNKHTIEDHCHSWILLVGLSSSFGKPLVLIQLLLMDYPLEKMFGCCFFHFSLNLF